jgi:flagella basal body P-ring formation protein FlgA
MNGRPLGTRKTIRLMIGLTILAWATQTLFHQWGYGAEVTGDDVEPATSSEKFVPAPRLDHRSATLELRSEARVNGAEVRLKQICRWSDTDAPAFATAGELVVLRFEGNTPFKAISLDDLRKTLSDAGINVGMIDFAGPTQCTISRADLEYDPDTALDQWIAARQPEAAAPEASAAPVAAASPIASPAAAPGATTTPAAAAEADANASPVHPLRDLLQSDLSTKLNISLDQLQVNFNPADQKLLNLSEPQFKFNIDGSYNNNLGDVSWQVLVVTDSGSKKASISANARAWQNQVVFEKPLTRGELIRADEIASRRLLVDRIANDQLLTTDQVVGQQASRDIQTGTVATAQFIEAVPLARAGQFITVTLNSGTVSVKSVAKAMEEGSYGQAIRVKSEATDQVFEVVLTGPQEATVGPMTTPQARADAR